MFLMKLELNKQAVEETDIESVHRFETHLWDVCYRIGDRGERLAVKWNGHSALFDGYQLATLVVVLPELVDDISAGRDTMLESYTQGVHFVAQFVPANPVKVVVSFNGEKTDVFEEKERLLTGFDNLIKRIVDYAHEMNPRLADSRAFRLWLGTPYVISRGVYETELRDEEDDDDFLDMEIGV